MNFADFRDWLTVIAVLITIANTIWVWQRTSGSEQSAKFKDVDDSLEDHGRRIQALEAELKHIPSKDDIHHLTISLTEMKGKLGTLESEMGSVARTMRRVEDHLLGERT